MSLALRSLRSTNVNSENPEQNPAGMKAAAGLKAAAPRAARAALGNLGVNQKNLGRQGAAPGKQGLKRELIKPARTTAGLTKQRGTASLQSLKQVQPPTSRRPSLDRKAKRSSSSGNKENDDEEPMEMEDEQAAALLPLPSDVEMPDAATVGPVEDIDLDDLGNPQMAVDYVNEIYAYMRMLERKQFVRANYMETASGKLSIKPKMRNLLIDWLIEVHQQFSLIQETLYLTVAIIDRYLQVDACNVTTKQLQLVGVSAMLVASKYEEMYPPEIGDFVYITDKAYKDKDIREMEIRIMRALDFDLGRPLPINFLRRNSKAGLVDEHVHGLAKYVMELTVVDYKMAHIEPSRIAAASLALAMRLLDPVRSSLRHLWTPTLQHYTAYKLDAIDEVVKAIAESVLTIHHVQGLDVTHVGTSTATGKKQKAMRSVSRKYCAKKFGRIAQLKAVNGEEGKECLEAIIRGDI